MNATLATIAITTATAIGSAACAVEDPSFGTEQQEGKWLNGKWLNGKWLNGSGLGNKAVAYALRRATTAAGTLYDVTVFDGALRGVNASGTALTAYGFDGAAMRGYDLDANPLKLYIDRVSEDPGYPGVMLYSVVVASAAGKYELCGLDETGKPIGPNLAVAVNGIWDYNQGYYGAGGKIPGSESGGITFACLNEGAIAKCVQLGYYPWLSSDHDLAHQSCTRMIRADYCGDGVSWTKDGTEIDIEDELPEQWFASYPNDAVWEFEALWGPEGARCIESYRYSDHHPELGYSLEEAIGSGKCPNMPRPVSGDSAAEFLRVFKTGTRAGHNVCGWVSPAAREKRECDPRRDKRCKPSGGDFGGYCTVNAKLPGTW